MFFGKKEEAKPYRFGFLSEHHFIDGVDIGKDFNVMDILSRIGGGSSMYYTAHLGDANVTSISGMNLPDRRFAHYMLPSMLGVFLIKAMDAEAEAKLEERYKVYEGLHKGIAYIDPYKVEGDFYLYWKKVEEINFETTVFTYIRNALVTRVDDRARYFPAMPVNVGLINAFHIQGFGV